MISPTIGRRVWYWPSASECADSLGVAQMQRFVSTQPFDAGVVCVWGDRMVNLCVTDHGGRVHERRSVTLVQEGDTKPEGGRYAEWMPYQQGQAKKQEAPAAAA